MKSLLGDANISLPKRPDFISEVTGGLRHSSLPMQLPPFHMERLSTRGDDEDSTGSLSEEDEDSGDDGSREGEVEDSEGEGDVGDDCDDDGSESVESSSDRLRSRTSTSPSEPPAKRQAV